MRDRRKRKILLGVLACTLVFMGIGYAVLSQMLTINGVSTIAGDWNVYIESITPYASGNASSVKESVGMDKTSATFEAQLLSPGDKVEYKLIVKNDGNIDAKLESFVPTITGNTNDYVTYTNSLENGYILRHGESFVFYVTTELKEDITSIDVASRPVLNLKLNFVQYTGGGSGEEEEDPSRHLLKSGGITDEEALYYYGEEVIFWNYYSNGDVEIVGNENQDLEYPWMDRRSVTLDIFNSVVADLDATQQSFVESLGDTKMMLVPFISGSYKTIAGFGGFTANNREEYLSVLQSAMPNLYNGVLSFIDALDEYGAKEITGIDIKGYPYELNIVDYTGNYVIKTHPINWFYLTNSEATIDLRDSTNITNGQFSHNCYIENFSGTVYFPTSVDNYFLDRDINAYDSKMYIPEISFLSLNFFDANSYNNTLFFYQSESDVPSQVKTSIQTFISNGAVSNVYYGCDDVTVDSCNKR